MTFLSGLLRQTFLALASIFGIVAYLLVSYIKRASYNFRPWSWRRRELLQVMERAKTYQEFKLAALSLDNYEGKSTWKEAENCFWYHPRLLVDRLERLREAKSNADWTSFLMLLRETLVRNLAGLGNPLLYTQCNMGTKTLIEQYNREIVSHLEFVSQLTPDSTDQEALTLTTLGLTLKDKERYFANARQAYGRSALLLSGGGSLGMYHFGVVKSLIEQELLPPVICGASIGALVACLLAASTDDEAKRLFSDAASISFASFEGLRQGSARRKIKRLLKFGILMDVTVLQQFCKDNIPDMTFQEAFLKTGRLINIVLTHPPPGAPHLLNHITSPNVLLWSAACASCVQPGLYAPVDLMSKDIHGNVTKLSAQPRTSFKNQTHDLPMERISQLFNVDHFIVSQTNPHVVAAIRATKSSSRFTLLHRFAMAVGREIHHRLSQCIELFSLPRHFEWFEFDFIKSPLGHVTIVPQLDLSTIKHSLSNPSTRMLKYCISEGEKSTFPLLHMIKQRCMIEKALHRCTVETREQLSKAGSNDPVLGCIPVSPQRSAQFALDNGESFAHDFVAYNARRSSSPSQPASQDSEIAVVTADNYCAEPLIQPSPLSLTRHGSGSLATLARTAIPTSELRIPRSASPPPLLTPVASMNELAGVD